VEVSNVETKVIPAVEAEPDESGIDIETARALFVESQHTTHEPKIADITESTADEYSATAQKFETEKRAIPAAEPDAIDIETARLLFIESQRMSQLAMAEEAERMAKECWQNFDQAVQQVITDLTPVVSPVVSERPEDRFQLPTSDDSVEIQVPKYEPEKEILEKMAKECWQDFDQAVQQVIADLTPAADTFSERPEDRFQLPTSDDKVDIQVPVDEPEKEISEKIAKECWQDFDQAVQQVITDLTPVAETFSERPEDRFQLPTSDDKVDIEALTDEPEYEMPDEPVESTKPGMLPSIEAGDTYLQQEQVPDEKAQDISIQSLTLTDSVVIERPWQSHQRSK
jgi:hypothetical protein